MKAVVSFALLVGAAACTEAETDGAHGALAQNEHGEGSSGGDHDEPNVAFGGEKQSGLGRLNGAWSLDAFTTMQWVSVNRGRRQFPY